MVEFEGGIVLKLSNLFITTFLLLIVLFLDSFSYAGVFRIINRNYGNASNIPSFVSQIDTLFDSMETEVNNQLSQFDARSYLSGTANSTALATAGGTHDLAGRFKYFYLEAGGGFGADIGGGGFQSFSSKTKTVSEVKGLSGGFNFTLGLPAKALFIPNIGAVNSENLNLYLSIAQLNKSVDDVNFNYQFFGLMGQYHFLGNYSALLGAFKWNGVNLTTGIKYSRIKILFSKTITETVQQDVSDPSIGGTQTMTMTYSTLAQLGANANITTIPVEVSTSVGLLYLFDAYVGLGADLNFGSANSVISSPGSVSATEPSGLAGTMSGDIEFDLGQKSSPQSFNTRYMLGFGIDFKVLSYMLQYNRNLSNSVESIHLGVAAHF